MYPYTSFYIIQRQEAILSRKAIEGCLIYRVEFDKERRIKKGTSLYKREREKKKEHMMGQSTLGVIQ